MNFLESFRVAFDGLRANKTRAFLTMLGVIIGVAAVILLVSVGQGVKSQVTGQIEGLGSNLITVIAGKIELGGGGEMGMSARKLRLDDAKALEEELPSKLKVTPAIEAGARVKYGNENRYTIIDGVTANFLEVYKQDISRGIFFSEADVNAARPVAVIGQTVVDDLFGGKNPLGEQFTVADKKLKVIGVLEEKGQLMGIDMDNIVFTPITMAEKVFDTDELHAIMVQARDAQTVDRTISEVKAILKKRMSPDDFSVMSQGEMLSTFQNILATLTVMLGGLAGISLLVGGIGIMNIMLVSVTERTREIGIRKAVGARTYDILAQFIIESVTLSLIGGAVGIGLGMAGSEVLKKFMPSEVTLWSVAVAFIFSAAVGVFFGVYPAWKASRLDPIDALRYE